MLLKDAKQPTWDASCIWVYKRDFIFQGFPSFFIFQFSVLSKKWVRKGGKIVHFKRSYQRVAEGFVSQFYWVIWEISFFRVFLKKGNGCQLIERYIISYLTLMCYFSAVSFFLLVSLLSRIRYVQLQGCRRMPRRMIMLTQLCSAFPP